jgi:DNA-directed RNA polymerase beta' subunit
MDLKMGVIDPGLRCKSCGSKLKECPGHFGYIELARPVLHINFVSLVFNLLKSTCRECGRILLYSYTNIETVLAVALISGIISITGIWNTILLEPMVNFLVLMSKYCLGAWDRLL